MHESRPAACRLPHPKRARACRRRSVEYLYPNYCVTPAAALEVLAQPQTSLAGICRYESHALGLFLVPFLLDSRASCACRPALLVYGKCTEMYGFLACRPPISRKDPFVCPARVRYPRLCCMYCGKRPALRIARRKKPELAVTPWPIVGPFRYRSGARTLECTEVYGFCRNRPSTSAKEPFTWPARIKNTKRGYLQRQKRPAPQFATRKNPGLAATPWPTAGPSITRLARARWGVRWWCARRTGTRQGVEVPRNEGLTEPRFPASRAPAPVRGQAKRR